MKIRSIRTYLKLAVPSRVLTENFKYMLWVIADYWVLYPMTNIALQG
jgi:hypothetical protein